MACCSLDAKGFETVVTVEMGAETFEAKGLQVIEPNFLEVYSPYMKWAETELPVFADGEVFVPSELIMSEHQTQPPPLLSESDLITIMDKSGIGTDATIHQHIKTIQDRRYAEKTPNGLFKATSLGLALVKGYADMGATIHEPELRAKTERSMNEIIQRTKTKNTVVRETLEEMTDVFRFVQQRFNTLIDVVRQTVTSPLEASNSAVRCFKCGEAGHFANTCNRERPPLAIRTADSIPAQGVNICFKCGQSGHYANACQGGNKKKCDACGVEGRHPKGSSCPNIKKKKPGNK